MLAAFKSMLHRLSGSEDFVVGIHTAGQAQAGLDNLVGHAVNILPIRSTPSSDLSFSDFVAQVKDSFLDGQDNQPFTFGQLLQTLNVPRDASRSPLVEVVFNLDRKVPEDDFEGLQQVIREIPEQSSNWDMFLNLYDEDNTLKADCDYNVDLFKRETISGWLDSFSLMLHSIVQDADVSIGQLDFYKDTGLDDTLIAWNQTKKLYPADLTLPDIFSRQAGQAPFKPAIIDQDKTFTYRDVDQRVALLARYFQSVGVEKGSLIGLCLERSIDMVVAAMAIMRSGAAYVPLDPDYPADRIQYMIEDSGMPIVVTQSSFTDQLPESVQMIVLDKAEALLSEESNAPISNQADPDGVAYMIYTSGSSGLPKGVKIPHRALTNFLYAMQSRPGIKADDIMLSVTTLSFDIAGLEIYLPLTVGARLAIARPEDSTDGERLANLLESVDATMIQATPATWKLLIDSGWDGKAGLKILCGGESLSRSLANGLLERSAELWNMYGPTETTIWSTVARVVPGNGPVSIGRPIANTQVYILNKLMRPVPVGVEGELFIGGDGLALGYHNRPELTAERFVDNPFGEGKLYQTRDIAKFSEDGSLICLGRLDNQVKIRGFRIELGEIEAALMQHPSVADAIVIAREDETGDKRIFAYTIQAESTEVAETSELRTLVSEKLPYYMVPSGWMRLDQFPLTPNGKIDRKALPNPEQDRESLESNYQPPSNVAEKYLALLWAEVLKLDIQQIGAQDDFFELGGHSLLATRVINRLKKNGTGSVTLLTFFDSPTIASLAPHIDPSALPPQVVSALNRTEGDSKSGEGDDREEFVI